MSQAVKPSSPAEAFQGFGADLTSVREALARKQATDKAATAALQQQVASLTGEKESLSDRVADISKEKDGLAAKVSEYGSKISSLEEETRTLESQTRSVTSTLDELKKTHATAQKELSAAKSDNEKLLERLAAMEARAKEAEGQVLQMAQDMAGFKDGLLKELGLAS